MKRSWSALVEVKESSVGLWVWEAAGCLAVRAELGRACAHPQALLSLLEGLALWSGAPLYAAISARGCADRLLDFVAVDEQGWPQESALVHFQILERRPALALGRQAKVEGFASGAGGS